ncbi:hypothetical protein DEO72_LG6g1503 [Vigna unguiculata]|uniref:Uncharacterized protein n=1 Tax=Vigna unguiculata TaxID=3917 RepID=A0A4D6M7H7_VIGUN|nr:hypothetical protein DEO72_LG6g1503 [Vigna unguiculata]
MASNQARVNVALGFAKAAFSQARVDVPFGLAKVASSRARGRFRTWFYKEDL